MAQKRTTRSAAPPEPEQLTPIVIDLGRKKSKHIKQLKKGRGRLMDEIEIALEHVSKAKEGTDLDGDSARAPVVFIYQKKPKKKKKMQGFQLPFGI